MCKCHPDPTIVAVKGILSITEEAKADTQSTKMMATAKRWSSGTTWNCESSNYNFDEISVALCVCPQHNCTFFTVLIYQHLLFP